MKTIDEHIDELAQEARDLEKKLTLMSDLKKCMREGHTWQFTVEDTFSTVNRVKLFCTNCGAEWIAPTSESKIVNNDAHNLGIDLADLEQEEDPQPFIEITQPSESERTKYDHLFKQVGEE